LKALVGKLQESAYALVLYCLVHRNVSFRRYVVCRADVADVVLVPILEALQKLPTAPSSGAVPTGADGAAAGGGADSAAAGMPSAPPAQGLALLLTLLELTGDRGFCEAASRTTLADGSRVLGNSRAVQNVAVSSLLIALLLKVAHWNFATCRHAFFNRAVSGILANLAANGVERLHWYTAGRMIEVTTLLARNALKPLAEPPEPAELHRAGMVREFLRSLTRLLSGCLRAPLVAKNCTLVYALQRAYPSQLASLEDDPEIGPPLRHVRAVVDWFQAQCPPDDSGRGEESSVQLARLEAASGRLPAEVQEMAAGGGRFTYRERLGATAFFAPEVWREARRLIPEHVCWSQPTGARAA